MRLLLYGTLRRGQHANARMLSGAAFVGAARTTPDYTMLDLGGFPGIRVGGSTAILGDVYEADEPTVAALDRYEGVPRLYTREVVMTMGVGPCWAYVLARPHPEANVVASGDWVKHTGRGHDCDAEAQRVVETVGAGWACGVCGNQLAADA